MPHISRESALVLLQPFFPDFSSVVNTAWKDWLCSPLASQMQHKRVRANVMWNQMISCARRLFDGHPRIRVSTMQNWEGIVVDNSVFIRLKKGDRTLRSRNFPTQSALAFNDPTEDLFGGIARLELLYVLGPAEASIESIALVQRNKGALLWDINVNVESSIVSNVEPFTGDTGTDQGENAARKVIRKKAGKAQPKRGNENGAT